MATRSPPRIDDLIALQEFDLAPPSSHPLLKTFVKLDKLCLLVVKSTATTTTSKTPKTLRIKAMIYCSTNSSMLWIDFV
jgi:hypothetical protein